MRSWAPTCCWQADERLRPPSRTHAHELQYVPTVGDDRRRMASGRRPSASPAPTTRNVHYAFVPGGTADAVAAFGAVR
ncbi:hypothetical protein K7G98_01185 [Saccharothrix sp. MB29]|nr:hypothetical protein [Saccharothrix sp. MB29]